MNYRKNDKYTSEFEVVTYMCQMNILVKSIQQIRMLGVWIVQAMITVRKKNS